MQELKVLWFEDNIEDFDEIIPNLQAHAKKNNRIFKPDIFDHYPENFETLNFEGIYTIAFIDLNLNKGQKGITIVSKLREYGAYLDTLLYSNNPRELILLTEGSNFVDGIYRHATLSGIEQKMCDVIDQVLYKEIMAIERNKKYNDGKSI